ncbi:vasotab-TY2-like [Drosophila albomicans]|uniref:Vasotab-TY2-like n=1 Tax=Drosophila albomicans TaxID=7291 RepID=A0A9C6W8R3_DROAB|nr:vasotab-TY2-like [Drosophila albomicans]
MKLCLAVISLLLCCSLIVAERECPLICPANYAPVCGEANVRGKKLRCEFPNSCAMDSSACRDNIDWRSSSCHNLSPQCSKLM